MRRRKLTEGSQHEHGFDLIFENHGEDHEVAWPLHDHGVDWNGIGSYIGDQHAAFFNGALADEARSQGQSHRITILRSICITRIVSAPTDTWLSIW